MVKKINKDSKATNPADHFSLVVGGPFHAVLGRFRLTGEDRMPTGRAAVSLALLTWLLLSVNGP